MFHNDMREAIELSKQEFEKQKQTKHNEKTSVSSLLRYLRMSAVSTYIL